MQRMLGHASAAMTLDIYVGLFGDDLDSVADTVDDLVPQTRHKPTEERPAWRGDALSSCS
ncbi:MAG: hypothetical protein ACRCSN_05210 [Dermatophilaceae bacterium]